MEEFCQLLTVGGRRDALLEDLHTVLCTIELSMARWADSVCVCVTTIRRNVLLKLSTDQLSSNRVKVGQKTAPMSEKCLFFK